MDSYFKMKNDSKRSRKNIPQLAKVRARLQKEIDSVCPFCPNEEVGHFQIHHIDENPANNKISNLILICPTCHSKIHKGDIPTEQVKAKKENLILSSGLNKKKREVEVTFNNGKKILKFYPKFNKKIINYRPQTDEERREDIERWNQVMKRSSPSRKRDNFFEKIKKQFKPKQSQGKRKIKILIDGKEVGKNYPREKIYWDAKLDTSLMDKYEVIQKCYFKIIIKNTGKAVVEDYKLNFHFEGEFEEVGTRSPALTNLINKTYSTHTAAFNESGLIHPDNNFLVQSDKFISTDIFIIPKKEQPADIKIKWQLLARDFNDKGELLIIIIPEYHETEKVMYIEDGSEPYVKYEFTNILQKGILRPNF